MSRSDDLYRLPDDLPVPVDDGACDHLRGAELPGLALPSTTGRTVSLHQLGAGPTVIYCYPRTGLPDQDPPGGLALWDAIPGARGCTPQACGYRDHHAELTALGATIYGLSTQSTEYQREVVTRLHLPFEILSDEKLEFVRALRLPTFRAAGFVLVRRLTLVTAGGRIRAVFYPVFPPDADAARVREWLEANPAPRGL